MYRSKNTAEFPNALSASPCASSSSASKSASFLTTRIPRPPPPNAALIIRGNPMLFAVLSAFFLSVIASLVPGNVGTLACSAIFRASILSPIFPSKSELGPIKAIPFDSHALAKPAFSDKKP